MTTLTLYVKDKILSNTESFKCECKFVACNTSYNIKVNFDSEWNSLRKKVRLMYKSNSGATLAKDLDLDNNDTTCEIPYELLPDAGILFVGVYADEIAATNTVRFWIRGSAKGLGSSTAFNGDIGWHDHDNTRVLDALGEINTYLSYNGRQIVDERVVRLVETTDDLPYDNAPTLCYVRTNRSTFVPAVLETGIQYGGLAVDKDKDSLYLDPLLVDFFPCERFVVTTEPVRMDTEDKNYRTYEFATDGSDWFSLKVLINGDCVTRYLYNNTLSAITADDILYPFIGWNQYKDGIVTSYDPYADDLIFLHFRLSYGIVFSTDSNFEDLQKILSETAIYNSGIKGLYVLNDLEWKKFNFGDILIELQSIGDKAHTHSVSHDGKGKVTISLSSGDTDIDTGLDVGGNIELG